VEYHDDKYMESLLDINFNEVSLFLAILSNLRASIMISGKKIEIDVEKREMMREKKTGVSPDARSSRLGRGTRLFYWLRLLGHH